MAAPYEIEAGNNWVILNVSKNLHNVAPRCADKKNDQNSARRTFLERVWHGANIENCLEFGLKKACRRALPIQIIVL